jgi:hypothetical protein
MQGIIERENQSLRKSLCTRHHPLTNTNNSLQVSQHVIYKDTKYFLGWFNNILVIFRSRQFYWWRKPEYPEKTTVL